MGLFVRGNSEKPAKKLAVASEVQRIINDPVQVDLPAAAPAAAVEAPARSREDLEDAAIATATTVEAQTPERIAYLQQLKLRLHQQLVERLDVQNLRMLPQNVVRQEVRVLVRELCQSERGLLSSNQQDRLMDEIMDETFGLGPLESLLKDPNITDILVNRHDRVYIERRGRLELTDVQFRDTKHLRQIIDRIVAQVGRSGDASTKTARWLTHAFPTAAASTRSSRRFRWTARRCRFVDSASRR
jgi:hypothetical protein